MSKSKNKIIIGSEVPLKNLEEAEKMKLNETVSLISKNLDEVCEAIENAVKISLKTGNKVSVYMLNGAVAIIQNLGQSEVKDIFKTDYCHIVTFELDSNYVYEIMDKQDIEKTLKFFRLTDEEIKKFYDWHEKHFYDDIKLSRMFDYNLRLANKIYEHIVDKIIKFEYNPLDIIDLLYESFTR